MSATAQVEVEVPPARRVRRRPRVVGVFAVTGVAVLVVLAPVVGVSPQPVPAGLPDAGPVTGWGLLVTELLLDLAVAVSVGGALVAAVLLPADRQGRLAAEGRAALRLAAAGAGSAVLCGALVVVLQASDVLGTPLLDLPADPRLTRHLTHAPGAWAGLAAALLAALAVARCRTTQVRGARSVLVLACASALPLTWSGHAASGHDRDVSTTSLAVHVVAASLWVGGLLGLLVLCRRLDPGRLTVCAGRYSRLALVCFLSVTVSGVVSAAVHVPSWTALTTTAYGREVLGKTVLLLVLGAAGAAHRRSLLPRAGALGRAAFWRLTLGEVVVMAAAFALAVALGRTPTPPGPGSGPTEPSEMVLGVVVPEVTASALLTSWRPNLLVGVCALAAVWLYHAGARRVRADGGAWPWVLTARFVAGVGLVVVAMLGGAATFAQAVLSVSIAQHVLVAVVAPAVIVSARPLELWRRARPPSSAGPAAGALRLSDVSAPLTVVCLYAMTTYGTYLMPALGTRLETYGLHLVSTAAALAGGVLLLSAASLRGAGPGFRPELAGAALVHLAAGAWLWWSDPLAATYFEGLAVPGVDLGNDQAAAGVVAALLGGLPLLALALRPPGGRRRATDAGTPAA